MSTYRELSTNVKRELKRVFPQCKFSLSVNHYGGTLVVCKAPKSWYTSKVINNKRYYYNSSMSVWHTDSSDALTKEGAKAFRKLYEIVKNGLEDITGGYYSETTMDMTSYEPTIFIFGTYSQPLEFIEDNSMKGQRTTLPKLNVRRMF